MANEKPDSVNLSQICRICLHPDERLTPVFDSIVPKFDSPPIAVIELWRIFNDLMVPQETGFPGSICPDCFEEIQRTYLFMLKCEKADAILKQIKHIHFHLTKANCSTIPNANEKEINQKHTKYEETSNYENQSDYEEKPDVSSSSENSLIEIKDEMETSNEKSQNPISVDIKKEDDDSNDVIFIGEINGTVKEETQKTHMRETLRTRKKLSLKKRLISNLLASRKMHKCSKCSYTCIKYINLQRHIFRRHLRTGWRKRQNNEYHCDDEEIQRNSINTKTESDSNDFVLTPLQTATPTIDTPKTEPNTMETARESKSQTQTPHFVKYINRDGKVIKVWECGICARNFQHQYTLMRHLPTHTNVRNFVCNECGKAFRQLSTLSQHRAIHSVDRPYACETCNKSFNRISTLISHRKTHSDFKPYRCHMCHKGFHQKGNLRNHVYIHTNERPYRCTICSKGFNQMSNLVCHTQKSHSTEFVSIWTCHRCNMTFSKRTLLRAHELETHQIGASVKGSRSRLASARKAATTTLDEFKTELNGGSEYCKSEISENGILIAAIDTDAMKIAKANKEMPFAVLHFFEGPPLLVRIVDYGNQSLLRPTKNEDFISLKSQHTGQIEKVCVPIVAAVYQTLNVAGRPEFKVMPPKNIYKFINHHQTISLNCDNNNETERKEVKPLTSSNDIQVGNVISLTPPQIPNELQDVTENLESPLYELLSDVKDETVNIDGNVMEFVPPTSKEEKPRAIAVVEESDWWKTEAKTDPYEETDGFSETFQNIATGSLLSPKKITESDIMPDQNASILDISQAKNPLLCNGLDITTNFFNSNNDIFNFSTTWNGCNEPVHNSMSTILDAFRSEGLDACSVKNLFSENPHLLHDFNECLSEILP